MTSLPRFSVHNHVLVGVTMAVILLGGLYGSFTLVREMFPESRPDAVLITTLYPGASPEEVEKGIALRLEEAIQDLDDVDTIETTISEGVCSILVEMTNDVDDIDQVVNEVKAEIDAIPANELPEEAEETTVSKFEPLLPVISLVAFGDADEQILKDIGETLRDDLLAIPGLSDIELTGVRKAELTVEVEPEKMIAYGLSLDQIADAINKSNLDLPGGQVKTPDQNVAVRTLGETDQADTIAETIIRTTNSGKIVRVSDVGRVVDGFEDADVTGRFNGKRAVDLTIYKTGDQDAIDIAGKVKAYVAGRLGQPAPPPDTLTRLRNLLGQRTEAQLVYTRAAADPLPANIELATHSNLSRYIEDRLELLTRNGAYGLMLVFLSLLLFLNLRVAFWVMMGLVVSLCGAIVLMNLIGATLNLISMFGLIVVLGIIVDDAIVVGENIYARFEHGDDPEHAAIKGAEEVSWPVTIAVLTTIAAFAPLMWIEGQVGDFMGVLPVVVMCALSVSLIESLALLPSHLSESLRKVRRRGKVGEPATQPAAGRIARLRAAQNRIFGEQFPAIYERFLRLATRYRYVTLSCAVAGLIIAFGLVGGGRVPFVFIQKMDSETIMVNLEMPVGTPVEQSAAAMAEIETAIVNLKDRGDVDNYYTLIGSQVTAGSAGATVASQSHLAQSIVELKELGQRERTSEEIIAELRRRTADLPGIAARTFKPMEGGPGGAEIEIQITGKEMEPIVRLAEQLKAKLATYQGVYDIDDDYEAGRREVQLELLDSARALNLTTRTLATEVRGAFFGLEARTLQREREDVDIRVRFPENRRTQLYELEAMRIATPAGDMVPLSEIARLVDTQGYSTIRRIDQRRSVTVSADVDQNRGNSDQILANLTPIVRELEAATPGVRIEFTGNKRETAKSFGSLRRDFLIALALIYVMLAGLFKSYFQPLIVLAAVPFGLTGAITGHFMMGYPLTILSMIGTVALTGIVVNDSLILVDFVNHEIKAGKPTYEAVIAGARRRLRPIILTSMTTILGLAPLMTETSFQARFLIPMAISISFGLAFATVLTLVVVPSIFLIFEDIKAFVHKLFPRRDLMALAE